MAPALAATELHSGDVFYLVGPVDAVEAVVATERLARLPIEDSQRQGLVKELGIVEVLLPPDSELVGQTLRQVAFRSRHGLSVLGIRRQGRPLPGNLSDETLAFGDVLLVAGSWKRIDLLREEQKDFLVLALPVEFGEVAPAHRRAPFALLVLLAMVVAMLSLIHI